jgi:hypothetical protein
MRIPGSGVVLLSAESRRLARELLNEVQKLSVTNWLASARERKRRDGLGDAVYTVGRGVQLDLGLAGESGLYVGL